MTSLILMDPVERDPLDVFRDDILPTSNMQVQYFRLLRVASLANLAKSRQLLTALPIGKSPAVGLPAGWLSPLTINMQQSGPRLRLSKSDAVDVQRRLEGRYIHPILDSVYTQ